MKLYRSHAICDRCYAAKYPGRQPLRLVTPAPVVTAPRAQDVPLSTRDARMLPDVKFTATLVATDAERCCFCGGSTREGIYVRAHHNDAPHCQCAGPS